MLNKGTQILGQYINYEDMWTEILLHFNKTCKETRNKNKKREKKKAVEKLTIYTQFNTKWRTHSRWVLSSNTDFKVLITKIISMVILHSSSSGNGVCSNLVQMFYVPSSFSLMQSHPGFSRLPLGTWSLKQFICFQHTSVEG